jgi:phage-related protein
MTAPHRFPLRRRRRWRDDRTAAGGRPVHDFLQKLTDEELAEVVAAMREVSADGLMAAKHLRGDLYEVKADAATRSFRVLFAAEGKFAQVLLSLSAFVKKTQKTPKQELDLAATRLEEWRARGKRWRKSVQ